MKYKKILPITTIYEELKEAGVKSYGFGFKDYTPSYYSNAVFKGAERIISYSTLPEVITRLFEILSSVKGAKYFYFYFDNIDTISHLYGPTSSYCQAEIISFLEIMDKIFWPRFEKVFNNSSLILFADHGQIEVNPKETFYINKEIAKIEKYLKINKKGKILAPAGSPRDMFLYIKDYFFEEAEGVLKEKLSGTAEVIRTRDLVTQGYFGEDVSGRFLERLGNLLLLPYPGKTVWWYEKDKFEMRFFGHHGGLTPEEMEVGLAIL